MRAHFVFAILGIVLLAVSVVLFLSLRSQETSRCAPNCPWPASYSDAFTRPRACEAICIYNKDGSPFMRAAISPLYIPFAWLGLLCFALSFSLWLRATFLE